MKDILCYTYCIDIDKLYYDYWTEIWLKEPPFIAYGSKHTILIDDWI